MIYCSKYRKRKKEEGKRISLLQKSGRYYILVAKLDVSEIPIHALHEILPKIDEKLVAIGNVIYPIDNPRDLSGIPDRQN